MNSAPKLTTRQAADYINVGSVSAVYRLIREHKMPFLRVGGGYRFDTHELDAWMHGHGSAIEWARQKRSA